MAKIYFRTDGNEEIATGHIMRCLSIARACAALHAEVCFLVSDEQSMTILAERFTSPNEFEVQCLHSDYQTPEKALPILREILFDATYFSKYKSYGIKNTGERIRLFHGENSSIDIYNRDNGGTVVKITISL